MDLTSRFTIARSFFTQFLFAFIWSRCTQDFFVFFFNQNRTLVYRPYPAAVLLAYVTLLSLLIVTATLARYSPLSFNSIPVIRNLVAYVA